MKIPFGKLITILLCLTMLMSLLPVTALAADSSVAYPVPDSTTELPGWDDLIGGLPNLDWEDITKLPELAVTPAPNDPYGTCGESLTWYLSLSTGVLTIAGIGAMKNYNGTTHAPWYDNRTSVKSIVMSEGVTSIGAYAFDGLSNLTAMELPESVTSIGNGAFMNCTGMADINLHDGITSIGKQAFMNCASLTKVTLPASIHKAPDSLFYGCTSLTEVIFPEGETELGSLAFAGCSSLKNVEYYMLTKIGSGTFLNCTALTVLNLPNTLTSIGKQAFSGSGLKMLKLPKGLTDIAFLEGTEKLTTIFIPLSVKDIDMGQFAVCENLQRVDYEGSKLEWKSINIEDNNDMLQNAEFSYNVTANLSYHEIGDVPVTSAPAVTVTPTPTAAPTPTVAPTVTPEPTAAPTPTPNNGCTTHDYEFTSVAPTCTEDGYGELVCTVCGAKKTSAHTDPVAAALTDIFTRPINLFDYPEYIPSRINPLFFDESDDYGDFKDVPAAEYEAVMAEYFVVTDELLDELRYHTEFKVEPDCLTYDASTDTYRISKTGGWGGWINGPIYQGYAVNGSTYEVYYAEAEYVYLNDVLPEGTNMYDYWEEQGDPESLDYAGYTFTKDPEGTPVCLAKVLTNGKKGIAEKDGDTYRIVDIVDYTEADLPDSLVIPDNKALGHDYVDSKCTRCGLTDSTAEPTVTPAPTAAPTPTVKPMVTPDPNLPGGECGEKAKWSFDASTGTLTIYGEGETENWGSAENTPWYSYRGKTKTIVIQNGITHIGTSAFRNFQNLTKISLPESLESIGGSVFFDCVRLSTIDIPESVSQIGAQAFYGCELLTEVTIPAKVTILETYLFTDCSELTKVVLPEGVTEIGGHAFSNCKKLTAINLPNSLERIRYRAFYHCTALPALKIPSGVTEIGDAAFSNCDALLQLALPEGIEEVNFISDCTGLKAVYLPKSIVEITSSEFNACKGLTDVYYGGNEADWKDIIVNEGNDYLLNATIHYNASGLPNGEVVTPEPTPEVTPAPTVKPVTTPNPNWPNGKCGANATWEFNTADGTLTIRGEGKMVNEYKTEAGTVVGYGWNKYQSVIKKVVIEDGITHISNDAFKECTGLKEVVMPESVTSIGDMVFWGTWNVEKFTIHPTLAETYYNSVPPYIENLYIYDLEHFLGLYQGKTSAGEYTGNFFTDAKNIYLNDVLLTDLVIPEGFTSVPDSAFSGCNSLKTVTLPDTVTTIGEKAFFECENLKDVKLSENLKEIEQQAFDSCKSLTSVTIPASVEIINERVFSNVKSIAFEGNAPLIAANAFMQVKADAYYPAGDSTWTAEKKENYGGELNWIEGLPSTPTPTNTPNVTPNVTPGVAPTVKPDVTPTPTPYIPATPSPNPELDPETCKHTLFFVAPQDATCTEDGFTGKVICGKGCGHVLQDGRVKPALGHNYKGGTCTRCGHVEGSPEVTPTPPVADGTPFVDMSTEDWFYEPVRWAVEQGITSGTSENTFSPEGVCTRAQIVTFLWAANGKPEPSSKSPFSDVKEGDWFYDPVIWAVEEDITSGTTETTFSPNIPCSRAQVVALLYKAVGAPDVDPTELPFTDVKETDYFYKAVCWAVENGIASGIAADKFGSSHPCTRAQIATFLYKAYNK